MPSSTQRSPFSSSFQSAVNRGTPASTAVTNIARRTKKTPAAIITSLFKAGVIYRQRFNGQTIIWPVNVTKLSTSSARIAQADIFQSLINFAIASGETTPEKITANSSNEQQFSTYVRRFFGRQFSTGNGTRTTTSQRSTGTSGRTTTQGHQTSTRTRPGTTTTVRKSTRGTSRTTTGQTLRIQGTRSSRRLRHAA